MNKLGKGPTLTWIMIGIAFAITVLTLSLSTYDTFLIDNNVNTSDNFNEIKGNLSSADSDISSLGEDLQDKGDALSIFKNIAYGSFNVFVTGLTTIGKFFTMGKSVSALLSTSQKAIPGLDALFGLLIMVAGIYIVMGIIKARRGTSETA